VAIAADGSVVMTGYFAGTVEFGGPPLSAPPASGTDAFLAVLDEDGAHTSSTSFGNDTSQLAQRGQHVRIDGDGNIVFAGTFVDMVDLGGGPITGEGEDDVFVAKYSPAGAHVWSKGFGNEFPEGLGGIAVDGAGAVLAIGAQRGGTLDFGGGPLIVSEPDDIFLLKLDAAGDHVWSRRFGITGDQDGGDVVANAGNEVIVTGFIEGTTDLGNGVLTSSGLDDVLLAKLPP